VVAFPANPGGVPETLVLADARKALFRPTGLMLRTDGTSPVCRAEHRSFYREQPFRGAAGMPHVGRGAGAPSADPR